MVATLPSSPSTPAAPNALGATPARVGGGNVLEQELIYTGSNNVVFGVNVVDHAPHALERLTTGTQSTASGRQHLGWLHHGHAEHCRGRQHFGWLHHGHAEHCRGRQHRSVSALPCTQPRGPGARHYGHALFLIQPSSSSHAVRADGRAEGAVAEHCRGVSALFLIQPSGSSHAVRADGRAEGAVGRVGAPVHR
jgi:hypothetical protein